MEARSTASSAIWEPDRVDEVTVVAVAKVKPEHEERALELLRGVIEALTARTAA